MMTPRLQYFLIVTIIVLFIFFINLLRQHKLDFKYCLVWIFSLLGLSVFCIKPEFIDRISKILGVQNPMNTMFFICIFFLTCICISLTVVISHLSSRIRQLTQNITIKECTFK
jgi:hypothetical protein